MRALAISAALVLAACGTRPAGPPPPPLVVSVPTVASCVPADLPPPPAYRDTRRALLDAPSAAERQALVDGSWFAREARLGLLEDIVRGCQGK